MSAGEHGPRYPVQRLEVLIGRPSAAEMALRFGTTRDAVVKWRARGLSERQADDLACRCGLWPGLVWPTWLRDVEPVGRLSAA